MVFRLRYVQQGGHIHCRLFTAKNYDATFEKCGDLVFRESEWSEVVAMFECGGCDVVPEVER